MPERPIQVSATLSRKLANMGVVAACMVVVLHACTTAAPHTSGWWLQLVMRQICKMAVPSFFMVSGFFLVGHANQRGWYSDALRKRLKTLVIPYFVWCLLWCAYFIPVCCRHGGWGSFIRTNAWTFLGLNLLSPPFYSVAWYLRALLFFILLSPVLIGLLRRLKWGLVVALCVGDVIFRMTSGNPGNWAFGVFHYVFSLEGAAYFVLGMGLRLGLLKPITVVGKGKMPMLIALALLIFTTLLYACGICPMMLFECFLIPFLMLSVWLLVPDGAWPMFLTGNAFPLYMIHPFALAVLTAFVFRSVDSAGMLVLKILTGTVFSFGGIFVMRRLLPRVSSVVFGGR